MIREKKSKTLGDYVLPGNALLLGAGMFGEVRLAHLASDPSIKVAVKLAGIGTDRTTIRMIANEIEALVSLSERNSEHLVKFLHEEDDGEMSYIVMELCDGNLREVLRETKILLNDELAHVARHISAGLEVLKEMRIMHRDLKPENILVSRPVGTGKSFIWEATFKIGDFGLSRCLGEGEKIFAFGGSKSYISPELAERTGADLRSDLWSFGVVLYLCAHGRRPVCLSGVYKDEIRHVFRRLSVDFDRIEDVRLKDLLSGLLRKDPDDRMTLERVRSHPFLNSDESLRRSIESVEDPESTLEELRKEVALKRMTSPFLREANPQWGISGECLYVSVAFLLLALLVCGYFYFLSYLYEQH